MALVFVMLDVYASFINKMLKEFRALSYVEEVETYHVDHNCKIFLEFVQRWTGVSNSNGLGGRVFETSGLGRVATGRFNIVFILDFFILCLGHNPIKLTKHFTMIS